MGKDTFIVASIGLDQHDQGVLLSLVTLAKNRKPGFTLFEQGGNNQLADILIVDADNPDGVKRWNTYLKLNQERGNISSVMMSQEVPSDYPDEKIQYVKKPVSPTQLLSILENIVITQNENSAPSLFEGGEPNTGDLVIGEDESLDKNNVSALVVVDSLPVRIQMKKALQNIASKIDFAETGEEVKKLIDEKDYNIVFLDFNQPDFDGYDICKLIKTNPEKSNTPVIMLTSNSSPADSIKGKEAGCDTYLIKPVQLEIFKEVIHEYLNLED